MSIHIFNNFSAENLCKLTIVICPERCYTINNLRELEPTNSTEVSMNKSQFFDHEIEFIQSEDLRSFVRFYFDCRVPAYFWTSGASSSGKFHPAMSQGEGGLVRHTKAVAWFCEELLRMSQWAYLSDERKDYARVACLLHDTAKYGVYDEINKDDYPRHGSIAANCVERAWMVFFEEDCPYELTHALTSHMGQWTTDKEDRPFTPIDRLVHMADYVASRAFIDIPAITADYNDKAELDEISPELPWEEE